MVTEDFLTVCNTIRTTTDKELSNRLLNMYFCIPHSNGPDGTDYLDFLYDFGAINLDEKYDSLFTTLENECEEPIV